MIKKLIISLLGLLIISQLACLELAFSDPGRGSYLMASPSVSWLVTTSGYNSRIYNQDLDLIADFSLPQADAMICGAGRDFDQDDNIEVLYSCYDTQNYQTNIFCRDISTGQYEFAYTQNSYYAMTWFMNGERIVMVNQMNGSDYTSCYIYRSNNPHTAAGPSHLPPDHLFSLKKFPNPFSSDISFHFNLDSNSLTSLNLYNAKGQKIRSFAQNIPLHAGEHVIYWDGLNQQNQRVPAGQYFFSINTDKQKEISKIIYLK